MSQSTQTENTTPLFERMRAIYRGESPPSAALEDFDNLDDASQDATDLIDWQDGSDLIG